MSYKMKDYDIWYQVCDNCGYDTAKSTAKSKNQCWKCGRRIMRDFSDRALKEPKSMNKAELETGTKPTRYALATRATLEKIAEDFREENKKLKDELEDARERLGKVDKENVKFRKALEDIQLEFTYRVRDRNSCYMIRIVKKALKK